MRRKFLFLATSIFVRRADNNAIAKVDAGVLWHYRKQRRIRESSVVEREAA